MRRRGEIAEGQQGLGQLSRSPGSGDSGDSPRVLGMRWSLGSNEQQGQPVGHFVVHSGEAFPGPQWPSQHTVRP